MKKTGKIILVAECPDGHGEEVFYEEMKKYQSPQEVITGFQKEPFRMGAHKAFLWARSLEKADVYMVSSLKPDVGENLMVRSVKSVAQALQPIQSKSKYSQPPRVAVLPKANSTYVRIT